MSNENNDLNWEQDGVLWYEVVRLKRDICYLYHELTESDGTIGDLDYTVYDFPYWRYLDHKALEDYDAPFFVNGCLVMALSMCWEQIDGAGCYVNDKIETWRCAISQVALDDEDITKLVNIVLLGLELAEHEMATNYQTPPDQQFEKFIEGTDWVHKNYVQEYFRQRSK